MRVYGGFLHSQDQQYVPVLTRGIVREQLSSDPRPIGPDLRWISHGWKPHLPGKGVPHGQLIGRMRTYPQSRAFAELLIDCEEDRTLGTVLVGMLRDMD
jgi:hypothetical protein